jgi:hypothetical protein
LAATRFVKLLTWGGRHILENRLRFGYAALVHTEFLFIQTWFPVNCKMWQRHYKGIT